MSTGFFGDIAKIQYEGPDSTNPLAFRHYNPDEIVMGKRMEDHLRFAVAYWHTFVWPGGDPFGGQTFERPWFEDSMQAAKLKADVAFEFFSLLGTPFYCFHDADVRPEGKNFAENTRNLNEIVDYFAKKQSDTGVKLLWGTANLFSHRRYMSGAASNPDPDVFAFAAATVKTCLDATLKLGGENYVLWGGREGYETLLNTNVKQELDQLGRFVNMVVEYKHKIGFKGAILIEPKPQEPTKHQYDYDVATVYGFLKTYGLENEVKVNIEQGHAILAGHSFEHELALANAFGIFGSIDMNRNDYQSGWDTDQFPNNRSGNGAGLLPGPVRWGLQDRRHQFRFQAAPAVDRSGRPADRPYRWHGLLRPGPARCRQDGRGQGAVRPARCTLRRLEIGRRPEAPDQHVAGGDHGLCRKDRSQPAAEIRQAGTARKRC